MQQKDEKERMQTMDVSIFEDNKVKRKQVVLKKMDGIWKI